MNPHVHQFFCPRRQLTDEHRIRSLEEESMWLQIRSLTLRLLASLTASGHAPSQQNSEISNENGVGDKSSFLRSLLSQLDQMLQTAAQIAEKHVQPLVVCGFQELTGSLQAILTHAVDHIRGQESGITAQRLASLSLEGTSQEASFTKAAMDKVQGSYLRSLQEVGDLLKKRAETIKNLKI
ncbi:hypothetical protein GOODEAATRI_010160 [Goodea atripinnis]|uniref:Uncharacterized protein n=1 Tax=Goodea atripinnis TaxID=208336 RepID=A0ABV0MGW2_9TELE